ncbi:hypothetical protein J1N35_012438 [Gossypium stocksii]|uniref:Uncharacterized protein n=1 Tax=Gossypium stocksii TaxID=47602 RepID=A0A9D3W6B6_9ROSI|nr:hypothetical protein J1N35_012438 [Gossypium stocksii]
MSTHFEVFLIAEVVHPFHLHSSSSGEAVKRETRLKQEVTCLEGESDGLKEDKLELQAKVKELECLANKHAPELASLKKEHESGHCD